MSSHEQLNQYFQRNMTRREFVQALGLLGTALAASCLRPHELLDRFFFEADLDFLESVGTVGPVAPREISGVIVNSPFLYTRSEAYIAQAGRKVRDMGASSIRMFINNHDFDPDHTPVAYTQAGEIDRATRVLEQGDSRDIGVIVDLYDGYHFRLAAQGNFIGPYVTRDKPDVRHFFTDPGVRMRYQDRIMFLVEALRNNS